MKKIALFSFCFLLFAGCIKNGSEPGNENDQSQELDPINIGSDFTIAVLPDPQYYTSSQNGGTPEMFIAQTNWIKNNRYKENIVYVACMGDITDHGNTYVSEWTNARAAMDILHDADIPYGIAVGNHDQTPNTGHPITCSTSGFNENFGVSRFRGKSWYGGHYGNNNDSHYDLFSAGGLNWIVFYIEYDSWNDDGDNMNAWADSLLRSYPDRKAIIVSHLMLKPGNPAQWTYTGRGGYYQGKAIYDRLKGRENLVMMLCGHITGEDYRVDKYNGFRVTSLLTDYQSWENGGNGYMRLITISTSANEIKIRTYSPYLDKWIVDANSEFILPLFNSH